MTNIFDFGSKQRMHTQMYGNTTGREMFQINEYNQRKTTPDNNTYIASLLEKLSNEIILEKDNFKSVSYIIFTDGISDDGYAKCDHFSAEQCGEGFKELNMNNDPSNKVYLIWVLDSQKNEIFRRIFSGMLINFQ